MNPRICEVSACACEFRGLAPLPSRRIQVRRRCSQCSDWCTSCAAKKGRSERWWLAVEFGPALRIFLFGGGGGWDWRPRERSDGPLHEHLGAMCPSYLEPFGSIWGGQVTSALLEFAQDPRYTYNSSSTSNGRHKLSPPVRSFSKEPEDGWGKRDCRALIERI